MIPARPVVPFVRLLACAAALLAPVAPLHAQRTPPASAPSTAAPAVRDLPLGAAERERYVGLYSVSAPGAGQLPRTVRVYDGGAGLMAQVDRNDPTRLLYQGNDTFRPEQAPAFLVAFTVAGGRATRVSMRSPGGGAMEGARVRDANAGAADSAADLSASGALYDELARVDSVLFDAAYVTCDMARLETLLAPDIEFFHDVTGRQAGDEVRASFRRLTANCPRGQGIRREVVPGTLRVYPIAGFGAAQTGTHRFVERSGKVTLARFVDVWQRTDGAWRLARVLSLDHHVDAP